MIYKSYDFNQEGIERAMQGINCKNIFHNAAMDEMVGKKIKSIQIVRSHFEGMATMEDIFHIEVEIE